jgi:hypothetical protein
VNAVRGGVDVGTIRRVGARATAKVLREASAQHVGVARLAELAAHNDPRVRVLVAERPYLPWAQLVSLSSDPDERVRQTAVARLSAGDRSAPSSTSVRQPEPIGLRATLVLARSKEICVQRMAGSRPVGWLGGMCVVVLGRPWAVASRVEHGAVALARTLAWVRCSSIVNTSLLRTTSRTFPLYLAAWSACFSYMVVAATRPQLGPRTRRVLSKGPWWGVRETLARRSDLDAHECYRLLDHPAVALRLAANPATPVEVVHYLANFPDVYVAWMAWIHPAQSFQRREGMLRELAAPAWPLARLLEQPDLPSDLVDEVSVLLVLGAGAGDPSFDPLTCSGSPLPEQRSVAEAYRRVGGKDPVWSPLWRCRVLVAEASRLPPRQLTVLATDCAPEVRRRAADFQNASSLLQLRRDPDPEVAERAETVRRGLSRRRRLLARLNSTSPRAWMRWAVMGGLFSITSTYVSIASTTTSFPSSKPFVASSILPAAPTFDTTTSLPSANPVCRAGGVAVWVGGSSEVVVIVVSTELHSVDARFSVGSTTSGLLWRDGRTVQPGSPIRLQLSPTGTVGVAAVIGSNPSRSLLVLSGDPVKVAVRDAEGDC